MHFKRKDSPYFVFLKCRDSPYVVHFKSRDYPYVESLPKKNQVKPKFDSSIFVQKYFVSKKKLGTKKC